VKTNTISVLVENHFGVLTRITSLFAGRGYNIQSLTVGPTEDASASRMTIVVDGDTEIIDQVKKQLNKLIDVIKVVDLTNEDFIDRELLLIKVSAKGKTRFSVLQFAQVFDGSIVDITPNFITIEVSARSSKIDAFIALLEPFGIKEMARTGRIALARS
jgi:acetolactate synthase-1/3 small subunit